LHAPAFFPADFIRPRAPGPRPSPGERRAKKNQPRGREGPGARGRRGKKTPIDCGGKKIKTKPKKKKKKKLMGVPPIRPAPGGDGGLPALPGGFSLGPEAKGGAPDFAPGPLGRGGDPAMFPAPTGLLLKKKNLPGGRGSILGYSGGGRGGRRGLCPGGGGTKFPKLATAARGGRFFNVPSRGRRMGDPKSGFGVGGPRGAIGMVVFRVSPPRKKNPPHHCLRFPPGFCRPARARGGQQNQGGGEGGGGGGGGAGKPQINPGGQPCPPKPPKGGGLEKKQKKPPLGALR